jgi:hypothetical protein
MMINPIISTRTRTGDGAEAVQVQRSLARLDAEAAALQRRLLLQEPGGGAATAPPQLPRSMVDFDERWRSQRTVSYCTRTHPLREAVAAVVQLGGWACTGPAGPTTVVGREPAGHARPPRQQPQPQPQPEPEGITGGGGVGGLARCASIGGGGGEGESFSRFPRVHWVAVAQALRARRVNTAVGGGGDGGGGGAALLSQLHRWPRSEGVGARAPGCPPVLASFKQAGVAVPAAWDNCQARGRRGRHRLIQKFRNSPAYLHFLQVYRRFVADVIVPLVGDPHGVVFQCPPTYVRLLKIVIY